MPRALAYLNRGLRSSHGGEWLWGGGCPIVPRAPGLIWVHGPWAGDVMVDGSIRWERLRPLILRMTAALGRVSRQPRELAGRLGAIWEMVGMAEAIGGSSSDGLQGVGTELAQGVKAAPGEFSGDRQRRARVREPALLERQVVGPVGARRTAGRLG